MYYATRMVDDDGRCAAAIVDVSARVIYTATDGTVDLYESSAEGSSIHSVARVQDAPEDVVVQDVTGFRCDSPSGRCELVVRNHPYPYGSK